MMKAIKMSMTLATLLMAGGLTAVSAQAEDITTNSAGEFKVDAGTLELKAVPTFNFENAKVADLVTTGQTLKYVDDKVTGTGIKSTGTDLTVSDFRGTDQPDWNLKATLGDFKNGTTTINGSLAYATDGTAAGTLTSTAASVWDNTKAATNGVKSVTAGTKAAGTALTLPATASVATGTYDATITWTLGTTAAD